MFSAQVRGEPPAPSPGQHRACTLRRSLTPCSPRPRQEQSQGTPTPLESPLGSHSPGSRGRPLTQLCWCCTSTRKMGQKRENTFNGNCGITLSSSGCFLLQQERCHQPQDASVALEHQQRLEEPFSCLFQRNKSIAVGWRHRGGFLWLPTLGAFCMGGSQGSSPAPSPTLLHPEHPGQCCPGSCQGAWGALGAPPLSGKPPQWLRSRDLAGTDRLSPQCPGAGSAEGTDGGCPMEQRTALTQLCRHRGHLAFLLSPRVSPAPPAHR